MSSACEAAGVSVGSYYRWHWESRRLSRWRVPNAVDTPYESLLREFVRVARMSRKRYLAFKRRVRARKGVVQKRGVKLYPTFRTSDFRFSVFISQTCVVLTLSKQFQVNRRKRQVENGLLIHNSKSPLSCANPFVTRVCRKNTKIGQNKCGM